MDEKLPPSGVTTNSTTSNWKVPNMFGSGVPRQARGKRKNLPKLHTMAQMPLLRPLETIAKQNYSRTDAIQVVRCGPGPQEKLPIQQKWFGADLDSKVRKRALVN